MTLEEAKVQIKEQLRTWAKESGWSDDVEVSIYYWPDNEGLGIGVRVAEISFSIDGGSAGVSYLQMDQPYGLAACASLERAVIALVDPNYEEEDRRDDLESLKFALFENK